jgi:hypothetical protein
MGTLGRLLFEYVGNLDPLEEDVQEAAPVIPDPRTDHATRELVDWTIGQMKARGLSADKQQAMLHDLRRAIRESVGVRD